MNAFWISPRARLLCAESLERRWLLSAGEVEIETSELPDAAIQAFQTQFPGAEILGAEVADDGNQTRTYDISGELDGRGVELTFPINPPPAKPLDPIPLPPQLAVETPVTTAPPAPAPPASGPSETPIEVVEVEIADAGDEVEVEIAPGQLPAHIRLALQKRFPGAELIEAEFSTGEDEAEYGVTAEFNDQLIDVSLTPDGQITEIEQSVTSGDLPEEVLAWLRSQFPGAVIDEAAIVDESGEVSYEVEFTPADDVPLEATLRVPGVEPPSVAPEPPPAEVVAGQTVPTDDTEDRQEEAAGDASTVAQEAADAPGAAGSQRTPAPRSTELPAAAAVDSASAGTPPPHRASMAADEQPLMVAALQRAAEFAEVLQAVAAVNPDWLPDLTAAALPIDMALVGQNIREILTELDELAGQLAGAVPKDRLALPLAVALAVVAGIELFVLESRKTRGNSAVVFNGASVSTWSWLVGRTTRTHHRSDE